MAAGLRPDSDNVLDNAALYDSAFGAGEVTIASTDTEVRLTIDDALPNRAYPVQLGRTVYRRVHASPHRDQFAERKADDDDIKTECRRDATAVPGWSLPLWLPWLSFPRW